MGPKIDCDAIVPTGGPAPDRRAGVLVDAGLHRFGARARPAAKAGNGPVNALRRTARIHLLCARSRPVVLVLRRKPTRVFHLVRWDTRHDTLEPGSWFFGRLYEKRCDVSPDGEWLVYFAASQTRSGTRSWTGLAHVPWLKAVAFHAGSGTWLGGGFWRNERTLCLTAYPGWDTPELKAEGRPGRLPFAVERHDWQRDAGDLEVLTNRFDRDWVADEAVSAPRTSVAKGGSWSVRGVTWAWIRAPSARHPRLRVRGPVDTASGFEFSLDDRPDLLADADWADYDALGQLVFARAGVLYRSTLADLRAGRITQSIDLEPLQPPARGDARNPNPPGQRSSKR